MANKPGLAFQPTLKGRALRLLATREHSRLELQRKLAEHAADASELARVLDELQARGFLDEARAAQSLVHRRAPRLGAARVKAELQQRGLPDELVAAAMDDLSSTEAERARAVWQKKFGQPPIDVNERARQMRFLAARGFAAELVQRTVPRVARARSEGD